MSTAGRPTFSAAVGKSNSSTIRTQLTSSKDQAAHTKLKFRQVGQASNSETKSIDFKAELELNERKFSQKNNFFSRLSREEDGVEIKKLIMDTSESRSEDLPQYDDSDVSVNSSKDSFASSSEDDSEDNNSDDDDDDELLQVELERIKQERAMAAAKKQQEQKELEEKLTKDNALRSNPLLSFGDGDGKIKRRWNDDVVFRNQANEEHERKKRFINDTVRSDFHRSFLNKYIK